MAFLTALVALRQPYLDLPPGAVPVQVADIPLTETDLIQEPDQLGNYDLIRAFHARQDMLADA